VSTSPTEHLSQTDLEYIRSTGRDPEQVVFQLDYLRGGKKSTPILRPATIGDGIRRLEDADSAALIALHEEACRAGRVSGFVPASGSGTRLFSSLLHLHRDRETDLERVRWRASRGDEVARDALIVLENITQFAVWPELERLGCAPGSVDHILRMLFGEGGLRCHERPKGLVPFHLYPEGVRTAVAEHLNEIAAVMAGGREARVHFTISDAHRPLFDKELSKETSRLEQALGLKFHIAMSVQSPATDTIAVDLEGHIRRDSAGRIVFHAGGHGALLPNLQQSNGDVVLIKNIDNIARRELVARISHLRRMISGMLLQIEKEVHAAVRRLRDGGSVGDALRVLERQFGLRPPGPVADDEAGRRNVMSQLNRPIRVCGVVATLEHAGGRPFWTDTGSRGPSPQLIEGAEVDLDNPRDRKLFHQSRHFNPVDLACSIRDADGQPFDLASFVIPDRALVARKVLSGVPSLLYEHPGLWNGSMGLWNTTFVEIPDFAFNPVKSISDLWASGHRP